MTDGMMNDTDPEVALLEALEFDPICEVEIQRKLRFFMIPLGGWQSCKAPAQWIGEFPCCGSSVLSCENHKRISHFRECCGRQFTPEFLTWTRI